MDVAGFHQHLQSGATTVCRCWSVTRRDGVAFGFTDHDRDLAFEGVIFRADTGLTARALAQSTGLSVDNTEALGADLVPGDLIRLEAGCDKRAETCRAKFANFLNFRGFPHIPGEDWLTTFPARDGVNDGGSLNR